MDWKKFAFLLNQEAKRVQKETFPVNPRERTVSVVVAGLAAGYVLEGLAKCVALAAEESDGCEG